jgi:hypothetical protein
MDDITVDDIIRAFEELSLNDIALSAMLDAFSVDQLEEYGLAAYRPNGGDETYLSTGICIFCFIL